LFTRNFGFDASAVNGAAAAVAGLSLRVSVSLDSSRGLFSRGTNVPSFFATTSDLFVANAIFY
jgi:hypothetical protein